VFTSDDARRWDRVATLDFATTVLRTSSFGLLTIGTKNGWLSATSVDGTSWRTAPLALAPISAVTSTFIDGNTAVMAAVERPLVRLSSSTDGVTWRDAPSPPCAPAPGNPGLGGAAPGIWAVVVSAERPTLAVTADHGATWSCTDLTGPAFDSSPRHGAAAINSIVETQGKLVLIGGVALEPGADGANYAAAIWTLQ
jgi:hypothetical protein